MSTRAAAHPETLDQRLSDGPRKVRLTLASGRPRHTVTATVTFPPAGMWGASVFPDISERHPALSWGPAAVPVSLTAFRWRRLRTRRRA